MSAPDYRPRVVQKMIRNTHCPHTLISLVRPYEIFAFLSCLVEMSHGHFGPCAFCSPFDWLCQERARLNCNPIRPSCAKRTTYLATPQLYMRSLASTAALSVLCANTGLLLVTRILRRVLLQKSDAHRTSAQAVQCVMFE